jgi:hypothetical protein
LLTKAGNLLLHVEDALGGIRLNRDLSNVKEYHNKIVAKDNMTAAQIDRIFEDVESADIDYSDKFRHNADMLREIKNDLSRSADAIGAIDFIVNFDPALLRSKLTSSGYKEQLYLDQLPLLQERYAGRKDGRDLERIIFLVSAHYNCPIPQNGERDPQTLVTMIGDRYRGSDVSLISNAERDLLVFCYEALHPENAKNMNTFLKPMSKGGDHAEDIQNIKYLAYASPQPYHDVFFKYLPQVKTLVDHTGKKGAQHYNSYARSVNVNFTNLNYQTFFHEMGHAVDHAMGGHKGYASAALFPTLESDVFGNIEATIKTVGNGDATDEAAVLAAFRYNADTSKLTTAQQTIYDDVVNTFLGTGREQKGIVRNRAAGDVYGGYTENKIITDRSGTIRASHHPTVYDDGTIYWYNSSKKPPQTGAQNREFFATVFADNIFDNSGTLSSDRSFFPNAMPEMDVLVNNYK